MTSKSRSGLVSIIKSLILPGVVCNVPRVPERLGARRADSSLSTMSVAALVSSIVTAQSGFRLVGTQSARPSRLVRLRSAFSVAHRPGATQTGPSAPAQGPDL